jgi:predicted anti-sigma-YlaC factor YlaD
MTGHHMTCADHQRTINRFIDHEFRAVECAELFAHLGTCAECRGFLDALMKLNAELDRIQIAAELEKAPSMQPRPFVDRNAVRGVVKQRSFRSRVSTLALLVIVTFFIGILLSIDITMQRSPDPHPQELVQPR